MEPPHQTGPRNGLKYINTCHGQDPGLAFVPPTILELGFFVPHCTFPSNERQYSVMMHKNFNCYYDYSPKHVIDVVRAEKDCKRGKLRALKLDWQTQKL